MVSERPPVVLSWAAFQPRTAGLAAALGGRPCFVHSRRLALIAILVPVRYAWAAVCSWRLLQHFDPSVVIVVSPPLPAVLLAWAWCRARGRRLVLDCHTGAYTGRKWSWTRPLHRFLFRRAAAVLHNTADETAMAESLGARALHVPDDLPGLEHAETLERSPRPRVLVAGSFDSSEPVETVLAAAARLPGVEVRLTGDPRRLAGSVRSKAPSNVVFTGYLPYRRFLGEMLAADVVAVLSADGDEVTYRLNRSSCEAIGLGRPVVLLDTPGNRSNFGAAALICRGEAGSIAGALDLALARKVDLAARSRRLRRRLQRERREAIARLQATLQPATRPRRSGPQTVLLITEHVYPNHAILRRNVEQLLRQGAVVDLVCMVSTNVPDWQADHPGLHLHRIRLDHRRTPALRYLFEYVFFFGAALPVVLRLSMRRRYSVVQVDNLPDFLVFLALPARWRGARVVMWFHELTPELLAARLGRRANHLLIVAAAWLERRATAFVDHVTVPSAACARILAGRGVDPARIWIVPNIVPVAPPTEDTRPRSAPVLITHGSLIERYGVQVAIRAVAELAQAWPKLTLQVLGDGEYRSELMSLADRLGLGSRVVFRGFLPWGEAMAEVQAATLGLVPVIMDGYGELLLPGKLFDYVATGTPAVCARLPAIAELFPPDSVAYFEPGDHRALAAQVDCLLRHPDAAREQAVRAREIARPEMATQSYLAALGLTAVAAAA